MNGPADGEVDYKKYWNLEAKTHLIYVSAGMGRWWGDEAWRW